jgi:signal transduction histidine kinase
MRMAWTSSAASWKAVAERRWFTLRSSLLMAHLAFLALLWHDRWAPASTAISDSASTHIAHAALDPAAFAILSGLVLALVPMLPPFSLPVLSMRSRVGAASPEMPPASLPQPREIQTTVSAHTPAIILPDDAYVGLMSRLHHDLRTPLNAMMGFADLMRAETFGPLGNERYRAYAAHMQTCGRELLEATETTLTMTTLLARPNHQDVGTRPLAELIGEAWNETLRGRAGGDRIYLAVDLPPGLTVRGDIPSISRGLVSLLGAAIARSGTSGPVSITASSVDGRVNTSISVQASYERRAATTGCRPATSACSVIEELPTTVSRILFSLQGIALVTTLDPVGTWTASVSLEAAAQSDLFEQGAPVAGDRSGVSQDRDYSAGFLAGGSLSGSLSA